jgi:hypothetical protein
MGCQRGWKFCVNCYALFYNGRTGTQGYCVAGQAAENFGHVVGPNSGNFYLPYAAPVQTGTQGSWRFCENCFVLFYAGRGGNDLGTCASPKSPKSTTNPGYLSHAPGGTVFTLPYGSPATQLAESNWRFCGQCYEMFYCAPEGAQGHCPAVPPPDSGPHAAQGKDVFTLQFATEPSIQSLNTPGPTTPDNEIIVTVIGAGFEPMTELKPLWLVFGNLQPLNQTSYTNFETDVHGNLTGGDVRDSGIAWGGDTDGLTGELTLGGLTRYWKWSNHVLSSGPTQYP